MGSYCLTFAAALTLSGLLTGVARHVARRIDLLDRPDRQRKLHKRATPLMGGVAVYLSLLTATTAIWFTACDHFDLDTNSGWFASMLLLSGGLLCAIGLWDDKWGIRARNKFLLQILATLPFVLWGRTISAVTMFGVSLDVAWIGIPLTVFWLVSCTNVVNLMDGLDGLASTVSLISCLTVAVLAQLNGLATVSVLATLLAGSLTGFLLHNWPPAKIFLGDSGSLPIGFFVGALALEASVKKATGFMMLVPLVLLSVPIFDTCMAILRRKLNGQTIGQADRAHIHHCLRDRGLSTRQTLFAIGSLSALMAVASVVSSLYNNEAIAVGICAAVLAVLVIGRIFGDREARLLWQHVIAIGGWMQSAPAAIRDRIVLARLESRGDAAADDVWNQLVVIAQRMSARSVIVLRGDDSSRRETAWRTWHRDTDPAFPSELFAGAIWNLKLTTSLPDQSSASIEISASAPMPSQAQQIESLLNLFAVLCQLDFAGERASEPRILPVRRDAA
ncbi:MAG: undecaprenyl/decaprenyl-phosphate alpha-N-acetylglucosaminyl 1-phosphate transferase [Planctomycetales bacterium]|nr:undecaprenyl/decaprenyl-phosphate alpha-N-acetylglucosaminyl 1-phosphate transferase [Planctomycetales bacterium]